MSGTDAAKQAKSTPWDTVDADAHNGSLGLNPINIDTQLFTKCIVDCKTAIARLEWYQKYIRDNSLDNLRPFSNEPGGTALTEMFSARGQDIIAAMASMQKTMEKMGDAFTTALRTYLDHEHMSRSDLDRIGSMSNVAPVAPPSPPPQAITPAASALQIIDKALGLPPPSNSGGDLYSSIRPAASMMFDDFTEFGRSLQGSDVVARTAGTQYSWMAAQVRNDMSTLHDDLVLLSDDGWTGTGKEAAVSAVASIRDNSANFADEMRSLGTNLQGCANWLLSTHNAMPTNTALGYLASGTSGGDLLGMLNQYRDVYNTTYTPGITSAASDMGAEPPPPASSPVRASATPTSAGGGGGGGGGGAQDANYAAQNQAALPTGPMPSGDVRGWMDQARQILLQMGYSPSQLDDNAIATIIAHESGGNPQAINLTDSNAAAGHPSKGLMQTIDSTFNAYMAPGHGDVWNPVDNIVAGVRYAIARYGSLDNVPGVVAVAEGHGYQGY
ncbi:hypothetical protein ABIA39_008474 [Nocardia sp. GAS34]|uniref:transglycosylase SLT domain-containing protein n=1 Tax=unclassified Nocardia TaxID=2637762 RepID=UPI003D1C6705